MQQNVQKSSSTILPRRSARVRSRPPVLSQARPVSSGARTRARRNAGGEVMAPLFLVGQGRGGTASSGHPATTSVPVEKNT